MVALPENKRDRREIGAARCSADTFLHQVSHQTLVEDGFKRKNTLLSLPLRSSVWKMQKQDVLLDYTSFL